MRRSRAPHFAMLLSLDSARQTLGGAVSPLMRDLVNEPMLLQVMLQLRAQPECDGLATGRPD